MTDTIYLERGGPNTGGSDDEDIIDMRLPTPTTRYRDTTVGTLLTESLDQLKEGNKISSSLYDKVLRQFDRSILNALSQRLTARVTFKATQLKTYRFLDGVWTFVLNHAEFREHYSFANVTKMKILAFDGKIPVPKARSANGKKRWRNGQSQGQQQ